MKTVIKVELKKEPEEITVLREAEPRIFLIRGQKVMLDSDLAALYGAATKRLNEAVSRNIKRFPKDFMFKLIYKEFTGLKSQIATSSLGDWGGTRKMPNVFTEHGAIMAASILNSEKAVEMSVFVVRAFVELRNILSTHQELIAKLTELEEKVSQHDASIKTIIFTLKQLVSEPTQSKRITGFMPEK